MIQHPVAAQARDILVKRECQRDVLCLKRWGASVDQYCIVCLAKASHLLGPVGNHPLDLPMPHEALLPYATEAEVAKLEEALREEYDDGAFVLRDFQKIIEQVTDYLWPGETIEEAQIALSEEAGEVGRAIIKRNHQRRGEGDRDPSINWTENLRTELAQTVIVALKMAEREGFDMRGALLDEYRVLVERAKRQGMIIEVLPREF